MGPGLSGWQARGETHKQTLGRELVRAPTQEEEKKTGERKRKREEVGGEKQKPTWPERGTGHEASFDDYIYTCIQ